MDVDIKEFFLSLLNEREKQMLIRLDMLERVTNGAQVAAKEAVEKANIATDRHFGNINELQAQMDKMQQGFPTRTEIDLKLVKIIEDLKTLTTRFENQAGQTAGIKWLWGAMVTAIGAIIGAVSAVTFK